MKLLCHKAGGRELVKGIKFAPVARLTKLGMHKHLLFILLLFLSVASCQYLFEIISLSTDLSFFRDTTKGDCFAKVREIVKLKFEAMVFQKLSRRLPSSYDAQFPGYVIDYDAGIIIKAFEEGKEHVAVINWDSMITSAPAIRTYALEYIVRIPQHEEEEEKRNGCSRVVVDWVVRPEDWKAKSIRNITTRVRFQGDTGGSGKYQEFKREKLDFGESPYAVKLSSSWQKSTVESSNSGSKSPITLAIILGCVSSAMACFLCILCWVVLEYAIRKCKNRKGAAREIDTMSPLPSTSICTPATPRTQETSPGFASSNSETADYRSSISMSYELQLHGDYGAPSAEQIAAAAEAVNLEEIELDELSLHIDDIPDGVKAEM